ncbi:N-acetyltransferase [Bacillus sp. 1P10SD]|uniref:GNAT family N-acetyltransferase n=1 Tax=Bacillus sp. 1P10SD TaxID=3132265 RepID=UPI0039A66C7D
MKQSINELENHEVVMITQENMVELMRFWNNRSSAFNMVENENGSLVKSPIPHPLFNNVIKTTINKNVTESVKHIINDYRERNVPFLWRVWDHDMPNNIGETLIENGGQQIPSTTLMAIDLQAFHPLTETYPELTIKKVSNLQDGKAFAGCTSSAFRIPDELTATVAEVMSKQDQNIANYVGYLIGTPVSISTIFYHNGIAGIYNVGTLPEFQGKGIGVEMMTTILLKAKLDGYKTAILHSTHAGKRLYEKLGFNACGEMRQYLFS